MAKIISADQFLSITILLDDDEPKNPFTTIDKAIEHLGNEGLELGRGWQYTGDWEWLNESKTKIVIRFKK